MDMNAVQQRERVSAAVPSDPTSRGPSLPPDNGEPVGDYDIYDDCGNLGPIRIPWSPLGTDEHEFSYIDRASRWTTIASSPSPPTTVTRPVEPQEHELTMICGPTPESLAPHHRINVIGHFYATLHTLLTNRIDSGFLGTFRTIYDLTPSTTWKDFVKFFREEAVRQGLPESIDRTKGERLTVWITAKVVVRKGKKSKEKFVELGKEGWLEGTRDLVRHGGREVRVAYFLSGDEQDEAKEKGKGKGRERREVGRRTQGMSMLDARAMMSGM